MTHQLPDGITHRPATKDDAERVAALWNDRSEATRGECPSTPERVLKNWDHPKFDLSTDSLLVHAPDGALIGYAHVRDVKEPPVDVFAGYSVRPDYDTAEWLWDDCAPKDPARWAKPGLWPDGVDGGGGPARHPEGAFGRAHRARRGHVGTGRDGTARTRTARLRIQPGIPSDACNLHNATGCAALAKRIRRPECRARRR
jgi:hypothetical protein